MSIFLQVGDYESVSTQATKFFVNPLGDIHLRAVVGTFLRDLKRRSFLAPTLLDLGDAIGFVNFLVRKVLLNQGNEIVCLN
jgi:hypothetical protein